MDECTANREASCVAGGKVGIAKLFPGNYQGANGIHRLSPVWRQSPTNGQWIWVYQGLQVTKRNTDTSVAAWTLPVLWSGVLQCQPVTWKLAWDSRGCTTLCPSVNICSKVLLNHHSGGDILIRSYGSEGAIVFCSLEDQKMCQTPRTQKPYRLLKLQMTWGVLKILWQVTGLSQNILVFSVAFIHIESNKNFIYTADKGCYKLLLRPSTVALIS